MSKKTTIVCDICGKQDDEEKMFSLVVSTGRERDAAGDMDDVLDRLDLCRIHYDVAFRKAIKRLGNSQVKFLMDDMRAIKERIKDK